MLRFLTWSIAANAGLGGRWRMVVTLARDGGLTPQSPAFAWATDFPITFRETPEALWAEHRAQAKATGKKVQVYNANSLHQLDQTFEADVVVFMDADTLVLGSIEDAVSRAWLSDAVLAWPAWNPPPVAAPAVLDALGLADDGRRVQHSGYGWSFLDPRQGLPYFNYGFVVCSRPVATLLARAVPDEMRQLFSLYADGFIWQVALTAAIIRHGIPFVPLAERYNYGNGEDIEPLLEGDAGAALAAAQAHERDNVRVLHYCVSTRHFDKHKVMSNTDALSAFLAREDLAGGDALLRDSLQALAARFADEP